jgi:putative tricarboxylic transport membrane protein
MPAGGRASLEEAMSEDFSALEGAGPRHRSVEIGVALLALAFGAIVIVGSLQVGVNWGVEGPKAGFFPFYIGVFIIGASAFNLVRAFTDISPQKLFASWGELGQVGSVVAPSVVYVALVPIIGIYVSSALLLAVFMKWLGRYPWYLVIALALGVPLIFYVMFEMWFLVPLPKGPVEDLLGL